MFNLLLKFALLFNLIIILLQPILCYTPSKRVYHNGVIMDHRLLVFSGYYSNLSSTDEMFYLDLSKQFNTSNITWTLVSGSRLPKYIWSAASIGIDSTIFLYGGVKKDINTENYNLTDSMYIYDNSTNNWLLPANSNNILPRQQMKGIPDNLGNIYIFGGYNVTNFTTEVNITGTTPIKTELTGQLLNDTNVFNIPSRTWKFISVFEIPNSRRDYVAEMLPVGIIVYIGGQKYDGNTTVYTMINIYQIRLFDTMQSKWTLMQTEGDSNVLPRMKAASVLTKDGYIIMTGGCSNNFQEVTPNLAVLNTNVYPYEWSIPSSQSNSPPSMFGHTANLYNNYMITTFGYSPSGDYISDVYILDVTNYTWVTSFDPNYNSSSSSPSPSSSSSSSSSSKKGLAIGLGIGAGVLFIIAIGICGFIFYKRKIRATQEPIMKISGGTRTRDENVEIHN
ncbi:hypothetical protein Glove_130g125 [Diversispora epigaea]|uniref:Galactose oxidase n=1 Tax=Diversispora epigaea TaxID=1348612 RepID=A0A397IY00_9GLOM|nr:hypothetical protein Glove_130g125 [Diversispora epigaea]